VRFEDQDRASSVVMPGFKPESDESKETHQVLSLLEELHNIISGASSSDMNLESDVQWVNEALSDQLRSQLSEPLSIATRVFPSWTGRMPKRFPFLFRDADRVAFLRCTSLGVSRAVAWLQDEVGRPFHLFFSRIVLKQERERESLTKFSQLLKNTGHWISSQEKGTCADYQRNFSNLSSTRA